MKREFLPIIFLLVTLLSSCKDPYRRLERELDLSPQYDEAFLHRQDSLCRLLETLESQNDEDKRNERFLLEYEIQERYFVFNTDSCKHHARKMLELSGDDPRALSISKAHLARVLCRQDSVEQAQSYLGQINPDLLDKKDLEVYYTARYSLLSALEDKHKEDYRLAKKRLAQEWWQKDSSRAYSIYLMARLHPETMPLEEAQKRLEAIIAKESASIEKNEYAKSNYYIARRHYIAGEQEKARDYLVESAITDIRISAKGYGALMELSRICLMEGSAKRAVSYIQRTKQDALQYNYTSRYNYINSLELEILELLVAQERSRKRILYITGLIILSLLAVLVTFFIKLFHSHRKVEEVSRIKDSFLSIYMERCVDYLNKVDEYRSQLRQTAKKEGPESILAMLRKPLFADSEFAKLLKDFDTAFLGIFPDFVSNLNMIMRPEAQFRLNTDGSMSTHLRILALIRIGIADRRKIAKILNMSVTTVYSYHTHLQQSSLVPKKEFDKVVMTL